MLSQHYYDSNANKNENNINNDQYFFIGDLYTFL